MLDIANVKKRVGKDDTGSPTQNQKYLVSESECCL